ncbi:epoxide hydrolase [Colletotrichum asianum]
MGIPGAVSQAPHHSPSIVPFTISVPQALIDDLQTLLRVSRIGAKTWENTQEAFGTTHEWLSDAKAAWIDSARFSWRSHEARINAIPNFLFKLLLADIDLKWGTGLEYNVHFLALFSDRKDAVPVLLLHGFPGSVLEYLPVLELLKTRYTSKTLPYHIVVPSLPGYGFSSISASSDVASFVDKEFDFQDVTKVLNHLMVHMGFGKACITHGGDVGTLFARIMAQEHDGCKAFHMNGLFATKEPAPSHMDGYSEEDDQRMIHAQAFFATGFGYSLMHQTKPGTIGLTVASSPLALLAWIGEKFRDWTEIPMPLETILASVTLYWLIDTYPRCIYSSRFPSTIPFPEDKPFGVANFPREPVPAPRAWVEKTFPNLIFYKDYEKGGHFPALEDPTAMLAGLEEFLAKVKSMIHADGN